MTKKRRSKEVWAHIIEREIRTAGGLDGLNISEMARKYGVSRQTIYGRLRKMGYHTDRRLGNVKRPVVRPNGRSVDENKMAEELAHMGAAVISPKKWPLSGKKGRIPDFDKLFRVLILWGHDFFDIEKMHMKENGCLVLDPDRNESIHEARAFLDDRGFLLYSRNDPMMKEIMAEDMRKMGFAVIPLDEKFGMWAEGARKRHGLIVMREKDFEKKIEDERRTALSRRECVPEIDMEKLMETVSEKVVERWAEKRGLCLVSSEEFELHEDMISELEEKLEQCDEMVEEYFFDSVYKDAVDGLVVSEFDEHMKEEEKFIEMQYDIT